MFKIISYLFNDKNAEADIPNSITSSMKEILLFHISYDLVTQLPIVSLKIDIYDPIEENFIQQAEQIAIFLFNMCGNNNYLVKPILDELGNIKKISNSHLLFINNVLFIWEKLMRETIANNGPLIKPSQVFKQQETEML